MYAAFEIIYKINMRTIFFLIVLYFYLFIQYICGKYVKESREKNMINKILMRRHHSSIIHFIHTYIGRL